MHKSQVNQMATNYQPKDDEFRHANFPKFVIKLSANFFLFEHSFSRCHRNLLCLVLCRYFFYQNILKWSKNVQKFVIKLSTTFSGIHSPIKKAVFFMNKALACEFLSMWAYFFECVCAILSVQGFCPVDFFLRQNIVF